MLAPRHVLTATLVDMAMARPNRQRQAFAPLSAQRGNTHWLVRAPAATAQLVDTAVAPQNQQKQASAPLFALWGSTHWQVRALAVTAHPAVIRQPRAAAPIPARPSAPPVAGPNPALHRALSARLDGGVLWVPQQHPAQEIAGLEDTGMRTVPALMTTARDLVKQVDTADQEPVSASRAQQEGTGTVREEKRQLFAQEYVLQESSPRRGQQRVSRVELDTTRPSWV